MSSRNTRTLLTPSTIARPVVPLKDQMQKPFLLLSGPEPDYQWDRFVAAVMLLVDQLDVRLVTLVDAIPLPVPHTRPLGVTTHGNADELLEGLATWSYTYIGALFV